ncbi:unnamed protein product [Moneuplotes crassus]|uniref:Uncharacterized protein n=1 Tax=Euplotes crassus TaxID=5936 RepID=A0AAD1XTT6_EUPCR|nr:unnamed protein product [Moneuplotes crassus]
MEPYFDNDSARPRSSGIIRTNGNNRACFRSLEFVVRYKENIRMMKLNDSNFSKNFRPSFGGLINLKIGNYDTDSIVKRSVFANIENFYKVCTIDIVLTPKGANNKHFKRFIQTSMTDIDCIYLRSKYCLYKRPNLSYIFLPFTKICSRLTKKIVIDNMDVSEKQFFRIIYSGSQCQEIHFTNCSIKAEIMIPRSEGKSRLKKLVLSYWDFEKCNYDEKLRFIFLLTHIKRSEFFHALEHVEISKPDLQALLKTISTHLTNSPL